MIQMNTCTRKASTNTPTNSLHISRSPHGHGATAVGLTQDDCAISVRFHGYCTATGRQPCDDCANEVRTGIAQWPQRYVYGLRAYDFWKFV